MYKMLAHDHYHYNYHYHYHDHDHYHYHYHYHYTHSHCFNKVACSIGNIMSPQNQVETVDMHKVPLEMLGG